MLEKTPKLTVKEAVQEYHHEEHNICRWIRKGKVNAQNVEGRYLIDRASLEAYLEKKRGPRVPVGGTATSAAPAPPPLPPTLPTLPTTSAAPTQPSPQPEPAPTPPPVAPAPPPRRVPPPTVAPAPPPLLAEEPPFDLRSGAPEGPARRNPSPSSAAKGASEQQKARDRKAQRKEARREAGKKYRKGPVHYAKDAMRHLDLAQLRDVRDWILMRMDQRMRPL